MKLFTATIAAVLISGAAYANESTRYNDLRLDTSNSGAQFSQGEQRKADPSESQRYNDLRLKTYDRDFDEAATLSTREKTAGEGYIYGGFGDGNDSR